MPLISKVAAVVGVLGAISCSDSTGVGSAGAAATLAKAEGDVQTAGARTSLATRPAVRVTDTRGNGVANATVIFSVASGGGSITDSVKTTDATGLARIGTWTLGSPGANTLMATSAGLTPVTFTVTATDPCATRQTLPIGGTISGTFTVSDCLVGTTPRDSLEFTLTQRQAVAITLGAANFRYNLYISGIIGWTLGDPNVPETFKVILPAGTYKLYVRPFMAGQTGGTYSISTAVTTDEVTACRGVATVPGITTQQSGPDCLSPLFPASGTTLDEIFVTMTAGITYTFTMTSAQPKLLELWGGPGWQLVKQNGTASTNDTLSFTPTTGGVYGIGVLTLNQSGANSPYTLTIR